MLKTFDKYTIPQLKEFLWGHDLLVSGTKPVLLERLKKAGVIPPIDKEYVSTKYADKKNRKVDITTAKAFMKYHEIPIGQSRTLTQLMNKIDKFGPGYKDVDNLNDWFIRDIPIPISYDKMKEYHKKQTEFAKKQGTVPPTFEEYNKRNRRLIPISPVYSPYLDATISYNDRLDAYTDQLKNDKAFKRPIQSFTKFCNKAIKKIVYKKTT